MRIGFDSKRLFHNATGLGNYSRDLLRILYHYYPENEYVLYNPKPTEAYADFLQKINYLERNPKGLWRNFKSLWRSYGVKNQIRKDQLDIYHGLSGELPLGISTQVKTVVTVHDLIFMRYPELYQPVDRRTYFLKFKSAAKRADLVVAISEQTKNDIVDFLQINPEKIRVIYQGCAPVFKENFSLEEMQQVKKKFSLPDQFVLNVGTIEPRKNALLIVKAIKNIDIKLVLIGKPTSYFRQIMEYARENKMEEKIMHLQGITQRELALVYRLATVMVYPSFFEGFGIPIVEALFSKTPVITSENGVFPEAGGLGSMYINPEDEYQLGQKIEFLLNNPEEIPLRVEKGYQYAQNFTDQQLAKQWDLVYKNLLKK